MIANRCEESSCVWCVTQGGTISDADPPPVELAQIHILTKLTLMLQFNRKVEYALSIVSHLAGADAQSLHSARSIAEATHIPFDMVTKCLQRLHRQGLCVAVQGKHGGYRLDTDLDALSIGSFLDQVFEPVAIAECLSKPDGSDCSLVGQCDLSGPMQYLNQQIIDLLHNISLAAFLSQSQTTSGDPAP